MTGIRVVVIGISVFFSSSVAFGQIVSVSQLTCNPNSLNSGASATCTVTLNVPAPVGGTEVLLSSNNTLLVLGPNSVIVPAGTTSTTFTATAGSVSTNQNVTLAATAQHSVLLNWSAGLSPNLMNYKVYRGTTSGGPYGVVTTLGLVTSYMDSNVQNAQTYYYVTTVVNGTGTESAYSNEASAVVPGLVSQSATVSLVAPVVTPATLSSLVCSPTNVNSGSATTCSVTLNQAAPNGGTVVNLASNNNLLPVPAPSVTVPVNNTSTTFAATAGTMASNQSATLTASLNGASRTATINLVASQPPTLSSLACNPTSLNSGAVTSCTITLNKAAPNGGTAVGLASNNNMLPVPAATVTVPANASSTTFTATAGNMAANQSATLTASLNGASQAATISLVASQPLTLSSLACNPTSLNSGAVTSCTITLNKAAPNGGTAVGLASNNNMLPVPAATVTVPTNATSTTFAATAGNMTANQSATLTASLNGASQTATVGLVAPQSPTLSSLVCNPTSLNSGAVTTCILTLSNAAPNGGMVVGLASNNNLLDVLPQSVTVWANRTAAIFKATAGLITQSQVATLTASLGGAPRQFDISLLAGIVPFSLTCRPSIIRPGASTDCTVTLSQAAPSGDTAVTLVSSNGQVTVPSSITVAAGSSSATFSATAGHVVRFSPRIKITASSGGGSTSVFVTIQRGAGRPNR
jgi:hypothetical protein